MSDYMTRLQEWESAWQDFVYRDARLDELRQAGRYGYQLRRPKQLYHKAAMRLLELDRDFCNRVLGIY